MDSKQKLMNRIKIDSNGCWIYTGPTVNSGYGTTHFQKGRKILAHRLAYELFIGQIPAGSYVCHKCDVKLCCNPDHLFVGTATENMQDATRKSRVRFGERHGNSKLTTDDVEAIRDAHAGGILQGTLARVYRVCLQTISGICCGKSWKRSAGKTGRKREKLTADDVVAIRGAYSIGITQGTIARAYRMNQTTISDVCLRNIWKHVATIVFVFSRLQPPSPDRSCRMKKTKHCDR